MPSISNLTAAASVNTTDLIPVVQTAGAANNPKKATLAQLISMILANGVASSGANSTITSLTGLSTPLSVTQGGTGVITSTGTGATVRAVSPTLTTPTLTTATLNTPTLTSPTVDSLNGGPLAGLRNRLINAQGLINQRAYVSGTATTGANQYTVDRWRVVTLGQALSFTTTNNDTTFTAPAGGVEQVIEGINLESGTYILSWTGTATATVNGSAIANGGTIALTGGSNVTIRFINGTFLKPQFEIGSTATPFERRPYGLEFILCQRYLPAFNYAGSGTEDCAVGFGTSTSAGVCFFPFKVPARVAPTGLTVATVGSFAATSATSLANLTALTFGNGGINGARLSITQGGTTWAAATPLVLIANALGASFYFTGCEL